jgi:GH43 family beta-xylosidase
MRSDDDHRNVRRTPFSFLMILVCGGLVGWSPTAAQCEEPVFVNPIAEGADPWVIENPVGSGYLWCFSDANRGIAIHRSDRLTAPGPKRLVWSTPESGPYSRQVWAPELHFLRGKWYIYFAASDGKNENHLTYVLESASDDPLGPYTLHGPLATGEGEDGRSPNIWSIDMTVLEVGDQLFAIWSGWDAPGTDRQYLYIAPMASPTTISGPRVRICSNDDYLWERVEPGLQFRGLNEAPQVLKHGDRTFLVYSCGASWLPTYRLGMLELTGTNPLDPASWKKFDQPVFDGTESTFGVGHSCFVRSPDRSQWWHIYHAKRSRDPGWQRLIFAQPFDFRSDGIPDFGKPIQQGTPQRLPSGESPPGARTSYSSPLTFEVLPDEWTYYGHHQYLKPSGKGLRLGRPERELVNSYRSGEKVILPDSFPDDLSIEVEIDFEGDANARDAGILFRMTHPAVGYDAQKGYVASLIPRTGLVVLGRTDGKTWTELARNAVTIDPSASQQLRVDLHGESITIHHQGNVVLKATDGAYSSGGVGLRVVDSAATFTNLKIEPLTK